MTKSVRYDISQDYDYDELLRAITTRQRTIRESKARLIILQAELWARKDLIK